MIRRVFPALFLVLGTLNAQAQFVSSEGGGSGTSSASSADIRNQPDNTVDTFSGLTFQIQRIVRDPANQGGLRLIMRVIETETEGRRIGWVRPAATITDEMGNIYHAAQSTGIPICSWRQIWDVDSEGCKVRAPGTPAHLTPSQPAAVVLLFLPDKDNFSPELAAAAAKGSFNARIGIFSKDAKSHGFYDVVINGIELPQGGS